MSNINTSIWRLKLGSPRLRLNQFLMKYKLGLLYLLDKRAFRSVLHSLNEQNKQFDELQNGLKSGHKRDQNV